MKQSTRGILVFVALVAVLGGVALINHASKVEDQQNNFWVQLHSEVNQNVAIQRNQALSRATTMNVFGYGLVVLAIGLGAFVVFGGKKPRETNPNQQAVPPATHGKVPAS